MKKILAIDDITINLMVMKEVLKDFDVRIAKSGELALYILGSVNIDLMLIDIDLNGMSGFEFINIVKEMPNKCDIPFIFVTSHATSDFILKAKSLGATDYVVKPIKGAVLKGKVMQALGMPVIDI